MAFSDLNVVCLKTGSKYSAEYVNRLERAVKRNLRSRFRMVVRFVCITDDPQGLACESLPPAENGLEGWWHKVTLFRPEPYGLQGRILFLDLDVVVIGDLTELFYFNPLVGPLPFVATKDWYRPYLYQTAVFLLQVGGVPKVWEAFNPSVMGRLHGDEDWINECLLPKQIGCWPDNWIASYKHDSVNGAKPDKGAKVVCFHGEPKPHQVNHPWVSENWI